MEQDSEARYTRYLRLGSLVRGGSIEPHWLPDGDSFWYAEPESEGLMVYVVDAEAIKARLEASVDAVATVVALPREGILNRETAAFEV